MSARPAWMDAELELVADNAARFFQREVEPNEARWRAQRHADRAIWRRAGDAGLLCMSIPEQYGGGGGSFAHELAVCDAQAYCMALAFSNSVHSGIVAHYILRYGTEAQKLRWLPRMASGELVAAIAMTEPGAGSDLQAITTRARRTSSGIDAAYVIDGSKTFITNGVHADLVCVVARTGDAPGAKGLSLIMVETESLAGFRRGAPLDKLGQHMQDTCELFFDEVRVPASALLGSEEGRGFAQLMEQLPRERLLIAVGAVASMRRAIEETLAHVKQRRMFGTTLADLQNTRMVLAECHTKLTVAQAFVADCIGRAMRGELDLPSSAMAKWWITQAQGEVMDACLQCFGGYGYITDTPIARLYADARVGRIYGGSNEVMKELVARSLLK